MLKTDTGTIVAPFSRQTRIPALYPKVWKNGLMMRKLSSAVTSAHSPHDFATAMD